MRPGPPWPTAGAVVTQTVATQTGGPRGVRRPRRGPRSPQSELPPRPPPSRGVRPSAPAPPCASVVRPAKGHRTLPPAGRNDFKADLYCHRLCSLVPFEKSLKRKKAPFPLQETSRKRVSRAGAFTACSVPCAGFWPGPGDPATQAAAAPEIMFTNR